MDESIIEALRAFDEALSALEESVTDDALHAALFQDAQPWMALLRHKLIPRLTGPECLVVTVAGGTNSGKSTVFNLLLGGDRSPVRSTAAATCHPVLAAPPDIAKLCLDGQMFPELTALALEDPESIVGRDAPEDALFVIETDTLPEGIALLDTPDVDSIDTVNWTIAENVRAAGDVVIAVLTGEKYKDDRVVGFFREARSSGRIVLPVMNKADGHGGFETAHGQLTEFRNDTGIDAISFILPYDPAMRDHFDAKIPNEDGDTHLAAYIAEIDADEVRESVYEESVLHFARAAGSFLAHTDGVAEGLSGVIREFNERAEASAASYDPVPGEAIGGLLHGYVQERRGPVRRFLGSAGGAVAKGVVTVGTHVRNALLDRINLDRAHVIASADDVNTVHKKEVARIARELATGYLTTAPNLAEPARALMQRGLDAIDVDAAADAAAQEVIDQDDLSRDFRIHAKQMLDEWWNDPKSSRRFIEAADSILAVAPAAVAVFVGINTAGVGTAELTAVTWPLAQQLFARAFEHGFGDRIFDFLKPWREEQRQKYLQAVQTHITEPATRHAEENLFALQGEHMETLRSSQRTCLIDLQTS